MLGLFTLLGIGAVGAQKAGEKINLAGERALAKQKGEWSYKGPDGKDYLTSTGEHIVLMGSGPNGPCWYGKGGRVVYDLGRARQLQKLQEYIDDEFSTYPAEIPFERDARKYRHYDNIDYNIPVGIRYTDKKTNEVYLMRKIWFKEKLDFPSGLWYMTFDRKLVRLTDTQRKMWNEIYGEEKTNQLEEEIKNYLNNQIPGKPVEEMNWIEFGEWYRVSGILGRPNWDEDDPMWR